MFCYNHKQLKVIIVAQTYFKSILKGITNELQANKSESVNSSNVKTNCEAQSDIQAFDPVPFKTSKKRRKKKKRSSKTPKGIILCLIKNNAPIVLLEEKVANETSFESTL